MKTLGWKKVLIIIFALILCFALVACNDPDPEKPSGDKETPVNVGLFLKDLLSDVDGIVTTLGEKSKVKHLDLSLDIQVGTDGKKAGETANYKIRIAGNFETSHLNNNDVMIEVKDVLNDKIVFAIYANKGKVYIRESITTSDKKEQLLALEGVEALQFNQYMALLPNALNELLLSTNLDLNEIGKVVEGLGGALGKLITVTKASTGNSYIAEIKLDQINEFLKGLTGIIDLSGILAPYADLINTVLPSITGLTIDSNGQFVGGKTYPKLNLNINYDDNNKFNGLVADYSWPIDETNKEGNGVSVRVGLSDINITNVSAPVTDGIDFSGYKAGALKIHADFNIPGLTAAGFKVSGDLYLKPGVGSITGDADSENAFIDFKTSNVTATGPDGTTYPLIAEYKYEQVDEKRVGRIYFDIAALCKAAGIYTEEMQTKYYQNFDVASLLIGLTTPVTLTDLKVEGLEEGFTATIDFKASRNPNYYVKEGWFDGSFLWLGLNMKDVKGNSVGTVKSIRHDDKLGTLIEVVYANGGVNKSTVITISDADMLGFMGGNHNKVANAGNVTDFTGMINATENILVFDANNTQLDIAAPRETGYYMSFKVTNPYNDKNIDKVYNFYLSSPVGSASTVVEAENLKDRLPGIMAAIEKDLQKDYSVLGYEAKIYGIWSEKTNTAYGVADLAAKGTTIKDFTATSLATKFLTINGSDNNQKYEATLLIVLTKPETGAKTPAEIYAEMSAEGGAYGYKSVEKYLETRLERIENGGENTLVPATSSDIQINAGSDFSFGIDGLGSLANKIVKEKLPLLLESNEITLTLEDAQAILKMGAYLKSNKLFASQIRMLLSNEKNGSEFEKLAVNSPYQLPKKTETDASNFTGKVADIVSNVNQHNCYVRDQFYFYALYQTYGTMTDEVLRANVNMTGATATKAGLDGWTTKDVDGYLNAVGAQAKTEYYFNKMISTYVTRVANHDVAYAGARAEAETKAMKAIRGYIGGNGILPENVDTVEKFLFGETLSITLKLKDGKESVIAGMPLSVTMIVKRGDKVLAEATIGASFIKASDIPENDFAADYWDTAVDVSTGYTEERKYSDAVVTLLTIHAKFAGFDHWYDVVGWVPPTEVA